MLRLFLLLMIIVSAAIMSRPHMVPSALRTVTVVALVGGVFAGVANMCRLIAATCLPIAGCLVGMLSVLGK